MVAREIIYKIHLSCWLEKYFNRQLITGNIVLCGPFLFLEFIDHIGLPKYYLKWNVEMLKLFKLLFVWFLKFADWIHVFLGQGKICWNVNVFEIQSKEILLQQILSFLSYLKGKASTSSFKIPKAERPWRPLVTKYFTTKSDEKLRVKVGFLTFELFQIIF